MRRTMMTIAVGLGLFISGCAAGPGESESGAGQVDSAAVALECTPQQDTAGRLSPYDSTLVSVDGLEAKICYSRPSSRGRTMIGGEAVPYGQLWRTGANEPTIIHLSAAAEIAGVEVEPGSYSLYTIPGPDSWTIVVNRSISQWGHESTYTESIAAEEVGRAEVRSAPLSEPIETFTIRSASGTEGMAELVLEWEMTRVSIPLRSLSS